MINGIRSSSNQSINTTEAARIDQRIDNNNEKLRAIRNMKDVLESKDSSSINDLLNSNQTLEAKPDKTGSTSPEITKVDLEALSLLNQKLLAARFRLARN